jgi:hypothetical protein
MLVTPFATTSLARATRASSLRGSKMVNIVRAALLPILALQRPAECAGQPNAMSQEDPAHSKQIVVAHMLSMHISCGHIVLTFLRLVSAENPNYIAAARH